MTGGPLAVLASTPTHAAKSCKARTCRMPNAQLALYGRLLDWPSTRNGNCPRLLHG